MNNAIIQPFLRLLDGFDYFTLNSSFIDYQLFCYFYLPNT